jgi:hypothetical protein
VNSIHRIANWMIISSRQSEPFIWILHVWSRSTHLFCFAFQLGNNAYAQMEPSIVRSWT